MELNKRETEIVICALSDYYYDRLWNNDVSNKDFLIEIRRLLKKIKNENKNK